MSDCDVARERMPQLLLEALSEGERETTHLHIESCAECAGEWDRLREAWTVMGALAELPVPSAVRQRFFATLQEKAPARVLPFRARPVFRWVAQAAGVGLLVGASFFAGRESAPADAQVPNDAPTYTIAGSRVIPASQLAPAIEGNPRIENVRFVSEGADQVQLAFDLTSRVTVAGRPEDESLANLLTYLVKNEQGADRSRSAAIEWIRNNPSAGKGSAEVAQALAEVLATETNEGVRLKAIDALREMPPEATATSQVALIGVLKNDPNPAVRLKAIEALAKIARAGTPLEPGMVDTLRQKAAQDDENLYVRVKAAEALSQIDL